MVARFRPIPARQILCIGPLEYNYLVEQNAITNRGGKYTIDYSRLPAALSQLTKELLTMEATGDRARAESWFKRYDQMPASLAATLKSAKDVPVDVDPIFAFPEVVN